MTVLIVICTALLALILIVELIILKVIVTLCVDLRENHRVMSPTRPIMHPEIFDAIRERKLS